jgi:hypothetical protein
MTTYVLRDRLDTPRSWPLWPFNLFLTILFLGPIISPLFRASGLPLVSDSGVLAHDLLSRYICPTPDRSYFLLGFPMAVCARCWGATIGLWAARLLPVDTNHWGISVLMTHFLALPWLLRLVMCALPFLLWPLEIVGAAQGWWFPPLWLILLNGVQAGFAAGLFFCSVWPGLWSRRA